MTPTGWIIAISIALIAVAFAALVVFLVLNLVSLQKTLKTTNEICKDLEGKLHAFDPYLRLISCVGQSIEKKACSSKSELLEEGEACSLYNKSRANRIANTACEITEWALIGLNLWQKIKERR